MKPIDLRRGLGRFRSIQSRIKIGPSMKPITPMTNGDLCWSGWCPKCGKTLISAVDVVDAPTDKYECGICE